MTADEFVDSDAAAAPLRAGTCKAFEGEAPRDGDWKAHLAAARGGDGETLGQLLDDMRSYLLLAADRELDGRLRTKAAASDIVQETLLEAGRDIHKFRGASQAELCSWLLCILRHNMTDLAREYRSARRRDVRRELRLSDVAKSLPGDACAASSIVRRAEADEQLDRAVNQLPKRYQQAIELRHLEGLTWEEVGRRLNATGEAARKVWARAIQQLRNLLQADDDRRQSTQRTQSPG